MLFVSEAISIFAILFFPSNHYLFASGIHPLNRVPQKI